MKTERKYSEIVSDAIEASGDAIYDWDLRSGAIEWLANACEVLGVRDSAEVSHAERYLSRVSPSCIGELRRTHTERAQTGARFTCSYEINAATIRLSGSKTAAGFSVLPKVYRFEFSAPCAASINRARAICAPRAA